MWGLQNLFGGLKKNRGPQKIFGGLKKIGGFKIVFSFGAQGGARSNLFYVGENKK